MMDDFSYDPMSEEQAQQERFSLLPEGLYDASIEKFEGRMSSSGNRMVVFDLNVYDNNGHIHSLKDFIAFTPKMSWKLRHHCVSAGLEKEFMAKTWRPHMSVGKMVRVKVVVQAGQEIPADKLKGKAPGAMYPDRNSVDDYIAVSGVNSPATAPSHAADGFDDSIPF
jgi:hypothetical protein